jgi:hypothetical protein
VYVDDRSGRPGKRGTSLHDEGGERCVGVWEPVPWLPAVISRGAACALAAGCSRAHTQP